MGLEASPAGVQKLVVREAPPAAAVRVGGHAGHGIWWLFLAECPVPARTGRHICWTDPECQLATGAFVLAPLVLQTERSLHGVPVLVGRRSHSRKFNVTKVIYLPHITAEVSTQWGSHKKEQGPCKGRQEPSGAIVS